MASAHTLMTMARGLLSLSTLTWLAQFTHAWPRKSFGTP